MKKPSFFLLFPFASLKNMEATSSKPYPLGEKIGSFTLKRATQIKDLALVAYEWQHPLGSRLLYLDKADSNKVFSVAFRTTPMNSTGVAHILEHVVLCGSKKYPVRDPFFSMLKRSLQNFMNAFTANDWTMYPFATNNKADFYNLMSVYLDASFFPLLREASFQQEGWRFEPQDRQNPQSDFQLKGVVFNEMKGAMSSLHEIITRQTLSALFLTNTYHYNSGGEPTQIPELTWQELKKFHQNYYHPSNAWFYLYGDLDLKQAIAKIEGEVLQHFQVNSLNTEVKNEVRWQKPVEASYPIPRDEQEKDQTSAHHFLYAWLLIPVTDVVEVLCLKILNQVLLGSSGSPLRKKLIESNLGKRLVDGSGFESDTKETFFVVGLQGVKKEKIEAVSQLILQSLQEIVSQGIDQELVESCLHQLELEVRELDSGSYGEGLKLLLRFFTTWLHGGDYLYALDFEAQIKALRDRMKEGKVFEQFIQKYLLENPHRVALHFYPDSQYNLSQEQQIQKLLRQQNRKADKTLREKVLKDTLALEISQNTKEDISCLPKVSLNEINKKVERIAEKNILWPSLENQPIFYRQNTNGMVYLHLEFALPPLTVEERLLLPSLGMILIGAGTKKTKYSDLALKLFRYTGGVSAHPYALEALPTSQQPSEEGFTVSGRSLFRNLDPFLELLTEICTQISFHDHARITHLFKQRADALYHGVVQSGHSYAGSLATRHLHPVSALDELYSGISQVHKAKQIAEKEEKIPQWIEQLSALALKIFSFAQPQLVCVGEEKHEEELLKKLGNFAKQFSFPIAKRDLYYDSPKLVSQEIWLIDTPVSYVAKAYAVPSFGHPNSHAMKVMATLLRGEFLHRTIREQGGAYGSMASYDAMKGLFLLLSYRDPNLAKTWENFNESFRWVSQGRFMQEELEASILQVFCSMDKPLSPDKKAFQDYAWKSQGYQEEIQNAYREKLLACTKEEVIQAAKNWPNLDAVMVAISSPEIWSQNQPLIENSARFQVHKI